MNPFEKLIAKLFGTKHDREMKRLWPWVEIMNSYEAKLQALSNAELQSKTGYFKEKLNQGASLDDILPEAFAVVRETSKRTLNMRHFDVQMIGGMVLHRGSISEMKTGEGKTLVATLPLYLNALTGKGCHLVTVNDYLAKRDAEWMGKIYTFLGMSVDTIIHEKSDLERKKAYSADIAYCTNNELGFDYLRDNMKYSLDDYVQRPLNYAIVDECDSILIDEARTPLIISGHAEESTDKYYSINSIIPHLKKDIHFTMEEKSKTASLTEEGNSKVEELLGIENLYDPRNIEMLHHVSQGLKAHHLFNIDVDYMIKDNEIVIVDEFTGRLMPGRRWSDGLHQAIEAKEGVPVKNENQTLASITFQNLFRMYNKLAGMTGTADTEAVEFRKIYGLDVVVVPTNKPICRADQDDLIYKTEEAKYKAIVKEITEKQAKGQPILVGTISIERSEKLSRYLKREGVQHFVLNAKHHEREAELVAQAGRKGMVTIATNMAGRGTDIVLGGNPAGLAKRINADENSEEFKAALERFKIQCEGEKKDVIAAGGLYILGTERHESRRIDNQLRGRSGRQGDPGESRFYLSLEDGLLRIFNGERIQSIMNTLKIPEDEPITAGMVSRAVEGAQRKVEGHNFDIRKHLLDFDDVMNQQRQSIYSLRRQVLEGVEVDNLFREWMGEVTSILLDTYAGESVKKEQWNIDGMNVALSKQFGLRIDFANLTDINPETLTNLVRDAVKAIYEKQKEQLAVYFNDIQRMIMIQTLDALWRDHLKKIDYIKEGINLRGYASRDPILEYKKEAFRAFEELHDNIHRDVVEKFLKVRLVAPEEQDFSLEAQREQSMEELKYQGAQQVDGFSNLEKAREKYAQALEEEQSRRQKQMFGGGGNSLNLQENEGRKLNRAERRKMGKGKKR